ncbi:MAG TPA: carbon-nitrogen hydrolase family protein [Prolixibacteraceae bacterium]|nr:carbon-nitrogen hydrolase family protein [Prolixibacteraceae bacterium]
MILASAQTNPGQKDVFTNLKDHYHWIQVAADNGANLIVFPEMSITGYVREQASELAFSPSDSRLEVLQQMAVDRQLTVVAGAPLRIGPFLLIGSVVFSPDGSVSHYAKQNLHPGEDEFFHSSMLFNPTIEIEDEKIALAICADIDHPNHVHNAFLKNSTLYMPSIFFSPNGIPEAHQILGDYASSYSMNILMSNFCGKSWGMDAGGKSAFWSGDGTLISSLDSENPGLLLVEKSGEEWNSKIILN